jgi:hypothetical protein
MTENLRTASLYINNQLLSRGLLRDGQNIDFANPGGGSDSEMAATMGRIMGVVNDLILRRDVSLGDYSFSSPPFPSPPPPPLGGSRRHMRRSDPWVKKHSA